MKKKIALFLMLLLCATLLIACSGGETLDDGYDSSGGNFSTSDGSTYTVYFDTDGGTRIAPMTVSAFENYIGDKVPTPEKEGYTFCYWREEGGGVWDNGYIHQSCTLTAVWEMDYYEVSVTVDRFEDTLDYSAIGYCIEQGVITLVEPEAPYGYAFSGWFTDPEYTTRVEKIGFGTPYTGNFDLYGTFVVDPYQFTLQNDNTYTFTMKSHDEMQAAIPAEEFATITSVHVPATYKGLPVTTILYAAFCGWSEITEVTIAEGVWGFTDYIFLDDTAVTSLVLPDSTRYVDGRYTLEKYVGVTEYNGGLYAATATNDHAIFIAPAGDAPVSEITLHQKTTVIAPGAFVIEEGYYFNGTGHPITAIALPDSVISICVGAFDYCSQLQTVVIGPNVTYMVGDVFRYSPLTTLSAPISALEHVSTTELTTLTLTGGSKIDDTTLSKFPKLTTLSLCDSITSISKNAFATNKKLTQVNLATGVVSFEALSFVDSVSMPKTTYNGCYYIGNETNPYFILYAEVEPMTAVEIHPDTKIIWHNAFSKSTALAKPTLPESVALVGYGAFADAAMRQWDGTTQGSGIYVGNTTNPCLILIGVASDATEFAMDPSTQCYATNIFANNTVIEKVTLPTGITKVSAGMFVGCTALKSVYLPDGVTEIGSGAFIGCTSLTDVRIPNSIEKVGSDIVDFNSSALKTDGRGGYYLGNESNRFLVMVASYANGSLSSQNCTTVNEKTKVIGPHVLKNEVYEIVISDSVTIISDYAFGCEPWNPKATDVFSQSIRRLTMGANVEYIGKNAFTGCENITSSIVLPDSLTYLGEYAFGYCEKISGVRFGTGLREIPQNAFALCYALTEVIIPQNILIIGDEAFQGCMGLQTVRIGSGVVMMGNMAFSISNSAKIYCAAAEKPADWHQYWIGGRVAGTGTPTVYWGQ